MQLNTNQPNRAGDLLTAAIKDLITVKGHYRKRVKPEFARFKASIEYVDGNKHPMFSIDFCKQYPESERTGFEVIKNWVQKCYLNNRIKNITIFITFDLDKKTSQMTYNDVVLYWDARYHKIHEYDEQIVKGLLFNKYTGKVNLQRLREYFEFQRKKLA